MGISRFNSLLLKIPWGTEESILVQKNRFWKFILMPLIPDNTGYIQTQRYTHDDISWKVCMIFPKWHQ